VPRERWELAQRELKRRRERHMPGNPSLLSGLLKCAECDGDMRLKTAWTNWREVVERKTQRQKRLTRYYVCYNYLGEPRHRVTGTCDAAYRRADVVEANVMAELRRFVFDPDLVDEV